ncbi:MAG TPA: peptidylprolyl isomerase [Bacteroidales bacterium]
MKKVQYVFSGLALVIMLLLCGNNVFAQKSIDDKTLVTIGNEKVTVGEFMQVYEKNNSQSAGMESSSVRDYLDLYIKFKLKVMEAEELQMDTSQQFISELEGYRAQLAKPYFVDESVNEALLQQAYNRKLRDIRASHILIMVDENASPADTLAAYNKIVKIRGEIMNGKDFGQAAVEYSDDPSARDREEIPNQQRARPGNKGDLGYFTVFNMVYPFENAAYETAVGEVSQPTRTKFGFHLVKVTDNKNATGVVEVAHVFVAAPLDMPEAERAEKKEKIENIYAKIQEGTTFDEAVVLYSEDKGSVKNGGKLSKFTCNRVVPEFVEAIEKLNPNDISEPVETTYGYHIIKLISREQPGTFEQEAPGLKEKLSKDDRSKLSEEAILAKIKINDKLKINLKSKNEVFAAIDTSVLNKAFSIESVLPMNKNLMKIGNLQKTQNDFLVYVQEKQTKQENISKDVYLEQLFEKFVNDNCLNYEDSQLEVKYPEFRTLMEEYHDGILLFNLTDEKVWAKAVKDTTGLEEFYSQNKNKYMWGMRADATVYQIKKKEDVEKVKVMITEYESDGDIAQALDADSISSVKMDPGYYEKGSNKYVDQVEWKAGQVQQINSDVEDLVVIVKVRKILPPEPKKLNEARGLVTADYQTYLEEEWIKNLKIKYPVVINEVVLSSLEAEQMN